RPSYSSRSRARTPESDSGGSLAFVEAMLALTSLEDLRLDRWVTPALQMDVRDLLGIAILEASGRGLADDVASINADTRQLRPAHQRMMDQCLAAPVLPIERSWPQMESLSTALLEAGGV